MKLGKVSLPTSNLMVGSFGNVYKIRRKSDGQILVWKELDYGRMSERERHQVVGEVNILKQLNHPNIVKYYDK
jgi:serine/threonine protein kinase